MKFIKIDNDTFISLKNLHPNKASMKLENFRIHATFELSIQDLKDLKKLINVQLKELKI